MEEINKKIDLMNARMDSFVEQINSIKNMFHTLDRVVCKNNEQYEAMIHTYRNYTDDKIDKYKKKKSEEFEKYVNERIREYNKTDKVIREDMAERITILEKCMKEDKFHDLLTDLKSLEDEFHAKAIKLVNKAALKKKDK